MNKFLLVIVFAVLTIAVVGIVLYDVSQIEDNEEDGGHIKTEELTSDEKKAISVCGEIKKEEWKNRCFAIIKKDSSLCTGLLSNKYQDALCYGAIAVAKADPLICEKIEISKGKDRCYAEVAKMEADIFLCDKVSSKISKNKCYWNIAISKQDFSLCEKIMNDSEWKNRCFAIIKKNSSFCDKISTLGRDRCYLDVAVENNDKLLCKKLGETEVDEERKQNKQTECIAVVDKDASLCEKIRRTSEKEACYFRVAVEKKDKFLCEKTGISKDECYWNVALNMIDLTVNPF